MNLIRALRNSHRGVLTAVLTLIAIFFVARHVHQAAQQQSDLPAYDEARQILIASATLTCMGFALWSVIVRFDPGAEFRRFFLSPYWYLAVLIYNSVTFLLSTGEQKQASPLVLLLDDPLNAAQVGLLVVAACLVFGDFPSRGVLPLEGAGIPKWIASVLCAMSSSALALVDTRYQFAQDAAFASRNADWIIDNYNSLTLYTLSALIVAGVAWIAAKR